MPKAATETRERLLDAAENLINEQGFAATSIDRIIEGAGVTKGTFFYHFKSKDGLARALIDRFAAGDQETLRTNMERAEKLSSDPLQQVLIFVGLTAEVAEALDELNQPGCLFATYCYESGLFDEETHSVISGRHAQLAGKSSVRSCGQPLNSIHRRSEVDFDDVADLLTVVFEGAFVMSRCVGGRAVFANQIKLYRNYLELLFNA